MMATAAISVELERHVSAIIVVVDIYPQMMREMIINSWPPGTIAPMVKNLIGNANHPLTRSLNDFDRNIIGRLATEGYSRCDVSLLYKLIRHLGLVETPTRDWGNRPLPGDINSGDDVERMKRNRNDVVHRPRGSFSADEKYNFFQESEGIALRIDELNGHPANGFVYRIQNVKSYSVTREKYIQVLENHNDLREQFQNISDNLNLHLYYGNDIEVKLEAETLERSNSVQNCSIYLRDQNMDVPNVIEKLDEIKQRLNEGNFDIKFRGSENKCLLIHIEIANKCFATKEVFHKAIECFLQKLFRLTSLDEILGSPVEVVVTETDNICDIDDIEDCEELNETDNIDILKLDVSVKDNVFQSDAHLYLHVREFCNEFLRLANQERPTNGSSLEVVMTVQENNVEQIGKSEETTAKTMNVDPEDDMMRTSIDDSLVYHVDMVKNSVGGYSFAVTDEIRLLRFLCLGNASYYDHAANVRGESIRCIDRMLMADKGEHILQLIQDVSCKGRVFKQTPVLHALAICARCNIPKIKTAAYDILPGVCRTPSHLFEFVSLCEHESAGTGWGRSHRAAINKWYNKFKQNPMRLAYFVTKYKRRFNWSHRDLIRQAHVNPETKDISYILAYVAKGIKYANKLHSQEDGSIQEIRQYFRAVEALNHWEKESIENLKSLIAKHELALEHIPGELWDNTSIWDILLRRGFTTATLRNLGKMSSLMIFEADSFPESFMIEMLSNHEIVRNARIHPFTILTAWKQYRKGYDNQRKYKWPVNERIANALENAFYLTFHPASCTAKRFCLAVDVSVSMTESYIDDSKIVTTIEAAIATMLATAKAEEKCEVVAFSNKLTHIPLSRSEKLVAAFEKFSYTLQTSGHSSESDCALPIIWAYEHKRKFDVFVLYTNSETKDSNISIVDALKHYREYTLDKHVCLVVVGMTNNGVSVANPQDPLVTDVVGLDTHAFHTVANFVEGKL